MRLEIDTDARLIRIKGRVRIDELFKTLGKMFPEMEFGDWSVTDQEIGSGIWNQIKFPGTYTGTGIFPQVGDPQSGSAIIQGIKDYGISPLDPRDFVPQSGADLVSDEGKLGYASHFNRTGINLIKI